MVATLDFDAAFSELTGLRAAEREERLKPPLVRIFDGDWNLRGRVERIISASIQEVQNETGIAELELPLDYWISKWITDVDERSTSNVHLTVDKDGARWSGTMEHFKVSKLEDGTGVLQLRFKHDYEHLKHIIVWSNPFLPAEVQFPKLWLCFGPSRWALKTTLLVNLMRLQTSLWMLPDDPMNESEWGSFDQSHWMIAVKPGAITGDTSLPAIVHSRFKNMHEVAADIVEDAQLTWEFRRYLTGDPEPWPGANLRNGCLVIDLIDKSGYTTGTSFWGSIFAGLARMFVHIESDGLTEGVDIIYDPNLGMPAPAPPPKYKDPTFRGTLPEAPWVIYRDGEHTGIQTSEFTFQPATDVRVVAGGHSMPGVNELISAAIQMAGDLTAAIPFVPPLGGVADAILKPLYTDVLLAFGNWGNPQRVAKLGASHYWEKWAEGGDRAYTLQWLIAMRMGMWETREQTSHSVLVADGAPYRIGQQGYGHFWLGDRIGTTARGMADGRVFIDRVSELNLAWDREHAPSWEITVGARAIEDPVIKAWQKLQRMLSILQDLGVM